MNIHAIIGFIVGIISLLSLVVFKSYDRGKESQRQENINKAVKDTMEIKKDESKRSNDSIDDVVNRMRKHTRD